MLSKQYNVVITTLHIMKYDKKANQGRITMILPNKKASVVECEIEDECKLMEQI